MSPVHRPETKGRGSCPRGLCNIQEAGKELLPSASSLLFSGHLMVHRWTHMAGETGRLCVPGASWVHVACAVQAGEPFIRRRDRKGTGWGHRGSARGTGLQGLSPLANTQPGRSKSLSPFQMTMGTGQGHDERRRSGW